MHINVTARRVLRVLGRKCVCGTLVWTLVLVPTHRFSWSSRKKCQHGANATKRRGSRWSLGASCWMYLFARTQPGIREGAASYWMVFACRTDVDPGQRL